jgi:hypothetical protein
MSRPWPPAPVTVLIVLRASAAMCTPPAWSITDKVNRQ